MASIVHATPYGDVLTGTFYPVLSLPERYLNDHCLLYAKGRWHLFGIVGNIGENVSIGATPSETSFLHASAVDVTGPWQLHPDVMHVCGIWPETQHVYAPYVIENQSVYYMYYCALDDQGIQRLCLATSTDLFHWQRYSGNPIIIPSVFWSKWPGFGLDGPDGSSFGGCRDPHVIRLRDGRFVLYWVSRLQEKFGKDMLCVAASISHDLIHWQEIGPLLAMKAWHRPLTLEVESPCAVYKDERYWLFFKNGWWTYVAVSDSPFDFWKSQPVRLGYAHAAEILFWKDQWWITHCKTDPEDYMQKKSDNCRGLFLGHLDWPSGHYPRLL